MSTAVAEPAQGSRRGVVGLLLLLLVSAVVVAVLAPGKAHPTDDLHPENPDPNGAKAVAQVLGDEGVDVEVATDQDALTDADVDRGTTLVVTSTGELGTSTVATLRDVADRAGTVVLVEPTPYVLEEWPLPARLTGFATEGDGGEDGIPAGCDDPDAGGLAVDGPGGWGYASAPDGPPGCFAVDTVEGTTGAFLLLPDVDGVTLLGAGAVLANADVTGQDNAALALRLLGGHERVVWYVPTIDDLAAGDEVEDTGIAPSWFGPSVLVLALATLALLLWRGRRMGPLVTEPLPVVVRSAETAESRGRLYRRVRDQGHAADALRRGTRRRLTGLLALPRGTSADTLVRELAARTGTPADRLHDLLVSGQVRDDASLVRLARDLADLERMQETDRP